MIHCVLPWYRINVRYFNFYGSSLPRTIFLGYEKEGLKALPKTKRDRSLSWGKHDRCTQIRGVWGKSWVHDTIHRDRQGWLNGADDSECHETLSHPASARFPVYSLLRRTPKVVFLGYFFTSLMPVRVSLSNVWYDIQVK